MLYLTFNQKLKIDVEKDTIDTETIINKYNVEILSRN